jgi:hypothetical protein
LPNKSDDLDETDAETGASGRSRRDALTSYDWWSLSEFDPKCPASTGGLS